MHARFLIAAALSLLHPAAAQAQSTPGTLRVVVQPADYPAEALAAHIEGEVAITLHLAADSTLRCTVDDKSAPATLQRPSCLLVARRWPFGPTLDKKGVPQQTDIKLIVVWKIFSAEDQARSAYGGATPISPGFWLTPDDYPTAALMYEREGAIRIAFDITEQGQARNCVVEVAAESKSLTRAVCPKIMKWALFLPAAGPDGAPVATRGFATVNFKIPR